MRCGSVGVPMLCLCTTLGQDGLTARLLVVRCERVRGVGGHARISGIGTVSYRESCEAPVRRACFSRPTAARRAVRLETRAGLGRAVADMVVGRSGEPLSRGKL